MFQDDKIGQLARLDRPDIALAMQGEGRGGRVSLQGFLDAEALVGADCPPACRGAADGVRDGVQRPERCNAGIAAEYDRDAAVQFVAQRDEPVGPVLRAAGETRRPSRAGRSAG
jgi:hypothetical protein